MTRQSRDPDNLESFAADFVHRHIGPTVEDQELMLSSLGVSSLDELSAAAIPASIQLATPLDLPEPASENEALGELASILARNRIKRTFVGTGYVPATLPPVIQRNVLESPGWYTQYTPYQAEVAQGRLEALLNFQTMVASLTGLPLANASLLDEATAAAEAMALCYSHLRGSRDTFFVARDCHPQTLAVVATRAASLGIKLVFGLPPDYETISESLFGALFQLPATDGRLYDPRPFIDRCHELGASVVMATDPLALTLLAPPGQLGVDVAVGSTQRFGLPLGFGGPHAAFFAARDVFKRLIPGRIVGVSTDAGGNKAYRLALQTREQHIRRERATSNICTAQALPAIIASFYAVYHGPEGLRKLASRIAALTSVLADGLAQLEIPITCESFFDTLRISLDAATRARVLAAAELRGLEIRQDWPDAVGVTLAETTTLGDVQELLTVFAEATDSAPPKAIGAAEAPWRLLPSLLRQGEFMEHPVFHRYHTEHELLRYLHRLQSKDLSLTTSMIPLGSCTMKLNGTAEMLPLSWREVADLHPFTQPENARGIQQVCADLEGWLAEITGLFGVSLQPNSGAQGEYAGLLVIRAYLEHLGQPERNVCLIPTSAHGTNPASATLAGLKVVPVNCDPQGNVDVENLRHRANEHASRLAALMVTYPSTHGVFEAAIREICQIVHAAGGQVYLDGANMNAQVGLCRPGDYGADVCHINLHKTFCIPHGGGGPGMGPIAVARHLVPFLPRHPAATSSELAIGAVAAAPYGSASVLPISWVYIRLMGAGGLRRASQVALLNANYMARRLRDHFPVLYVGSSGYCAHEFILDARAVKKTAGVEVDDIAKRLMDYGFHAPTMSFPVPGTLMIEPTESESRAEIDRFCDALIQIRQEIRAIETGATDARDNLLKNAPHTSLEVTKTLWTHPYSRREAAFPDPRSREYKFWPASARIDNAAGDRNLVCTCPSPSELFASE